MKKLFLILVFFPSILCAQSGYVNYTTFGFLKGHTSSQREAPLSFIMEHHGALTKGLSAGFMTGMEQLNENVMPVALSLRCYTPGKTKFFAGGYAGYSLSLGKPENDNGGITYKKAKGGFITGLETGLMIPVNESSAVFFGIGYRYNTLHYTIEEYWFDTLKRKYTFNRLSIRMGIVLL